MLKKLKEIFNTDIQNALVNIFNRFICDFILCFDHENILDDLFFFIFFGINF